jgi:pilus assembly protein CpaF
VERFSDGSRRVTYINEVTGASESEVTTQELFALERRGISSDGKVERVLSATGLRPSFLEKLRGRGVALPDSLFLVA